jgi:two-component sensor histidine kinase
VELSVADDGVGLPPDVEIKKATSLGLQLVQILADQLQATLEIHQDSGTTICIRMPRPSEPKWVMKSTDVSVAQGRTPR